MAREHTRFRKYKQILDDKLVSAELALRYWAHKQNFWDWVAIPVSDSVAPELLRGREQALTQTLQPPLNFPFIARWFCPRKGIIKPPDATFARKIGILRLWRKKRRKEALQAFNAKHRGIPYPLYAIFERPAFKTKEATWVLLTQLGSNTLLHFVAAKRLRSNECSFAALCALASVHGSHCTEGHHGCTEIPRMSGAEVLHASAGAFYGPRCIPQPASNMHAGIHFRLYSGRHSFSCAKIQRGLSQAPTCCTGIV